MRAVWIDAGNDPDYAKLKANGIDWPYFDIRDPRLTPAYLDAVVAHDGIAGVGVYAAASWWPTLSPTQFADKVSAELLRIGWRGNPPVCADIEVVDVARYVVDFLLRWRAIRPKRTVDVTIEGHKGALFSPADVIHVTACARYLVPQCYNGAMTELWDTYAMTTDLTTAGFPIGSVCPFYDAAHLPQWWGLPAGYAFTQGRLP